jgi:hypothetical protein
MGKDQMEKYKKYRTIRPLKTGINLNYTTSLRTAQRIQNSSVMDLNILMLFGLIIGVPLWGSYKSYIHVYRACRNTQFLNVPIAGRHRYH